MYDKLFGNYLLNKGTLSNETLQKILREQQNVRVRIGTLAITKGLMTGSQVEEVTSLQRQFDKRFGEIAIEKDYLSENQVDMLLKVQSEESNLQIGQAAVDFGYITYDQLEKQLTLFEEECGLNNDQLAALKDGDIDTIVRQLLPFIADPQDEILCQYTILFIKNIMRFLYLQPWLSLEGMQKNDDTVIIRQYLNNEKSLLSAMVMSESCMNKVAATFAKIEIIDDSELVEASVTEFLNLHNGIFSVNMSNKGKKYDLIPPEVIRNKSNISLEGHEINIQTVLGEITLILAAS